MHFFQNPRETKSIKNIYNFDCVFFGNSSEKLHKSRFATDGCMQQSK